MLRIFAPAKINLHLHVTGRRADGFHLLDSLISFADVGDVLEIAPANGFYFHIAGPFAATFGPNDLDPSPASGNLVVKAAWTLAHFLKRPLDVTITLHKNLPLGSGLGGGSADAAATLRGLCRLWDVTLPSDQMKSLATRLGSDVYGCVQSQTAILRGVGDELGPAPDHLPEVPALLVYPGMPCSTPSVYRALALSSFSPVVAFQDDYATPAELSLFLAQNTRNDLTLPAITVLPEIAPLLDEMAALPECGLARLSGSGSTCFGIFKSEAARDLAHNCLTALHPDYWVASCWLNRICCG